jgi:hypothetical protein
MRITLRMISAGAISTAMMVRMDTIEPQATGRRADASFTIPEWCRHRRISVSMYYKLRAQGKAPATLDVGRHRTITAEADAAWVRERQFASKPGNPVINAEAKTLRARREHADAADSR